MNNSSWDAWRSHRYSALLTLGVFIFGLLPSQAQAECDLSLVNAYVQAIPAAPGSAFTLSGFSCQSGDTQGHLVVNKSYPPFTAISFNGSIPQTIFDTAFSNSEDCARLIGNARVALHEYGSLAAVEPATGCYIRQENPFPWYTFGFVVTDVFTNVNPDNPNFRQPFIFSHRLVQCLPGSESIGGNLSCTPTPACPDGQVWNSQTQRCEGPLADPQQEKPLGPPAQCTGNPCDPATGNKYQNETDFKAGEGLASFTRNYNSQLSKDVSFGFGWTALTLKRLEISGTNIQVRYDTGKGEPFSCPSGTGTCSGNADTTLTLTKDASGYTLTRRNGATERYDTSGRLLTETDRSGLVTSYAYNGANQLTAVTGPHGHITTFTYSGTHISAVTDPSGRAYNYTYDANNNLSRVSYPDGSTKLYHYENSTFPHHLTGISYQEAGGSAVRYSTYAYDSSGKAIVTEHAGGIEHYGLNYDSDTQTTVTDAIGTQEVMTFASNLGVKNLLNKVNPSDGKSLTQTFDGNNNLTCKKDEEGRVTTYTYNSTNQRTSLTEGLTGNCTSPQVTSATRTTSYQYQSATLDLPTLIQTPSVAPGQMKTTTLQYTDAAHPALPTAITQSGYTPGGNAVSRSVSLTYTAAGQVASVNGARTDVNDVTTLSYYTCTTGGACGQLQSITNALGHITTFDAYDGAGRLTQMTDPNGLRTNYTYDARGRVTTITQTPPGGSARITSYTYNAANNVTSVSFPDGIVLSYTYDAAQKLRQVTDNQGNKVAYNYDLKGNRTQEATYDPSNTLARQIDTAYDLRNHVSAINNGGSVTQELSDALGNLTRLTDPNQVATNSGVSTNHTYDALNRLIETINNLSGVTSYTYDVADRLIQAKAPNNATTQYQYDDLGNLLQEISPDRGTTTYTYDAAGNVTSLTDARGVVVNYTYDALNRVTAINYPASSGENITLAYDTNGAGTCTAGLGRLCQVTDESGMTQYAYDAFGNLIQQTKAELGITYTTRYTYDAGNRVASLTYPDNRVVNYTRDSLGRIQSVTTTVNGSTQTIITNRAYRPDGLPTGQTYGNGLSEVRSYDARGNLTYQSLGGADTRLYGYDANGNLTQKQTLPEVGTYAYDALDRLLDEATSDNQHNAFTYDPNGNRTSDLKANGTPRPYAYSPNTNRLTGLGNQVITLDAAGNTTIDRNGNRVFTYNNANRLTQVSINGVLKGTYTYNYQTQRTRKVRANATGTGTTTFIYHYDTEGHLIAETKPNGKLIRAYLWAGNEPIAQLQTKGTNPEELSYLHSDHLNTPRLATNTQQTVVWRFESEAFGTGKPDTDPDADETKTNVRLRFPGQYADGESGLYYNWNRYYDPKTGRYLTSDPVGLRGGLNSYAYVRNNSLRFVDPWGLRDIVAVVWGRQITDVSVGHVLLAETYGFVLQSSFPDPHATHGINRMKTWKETLAAEGRPPTAVFKVFVPDDSSFDIATFAERRRPWWDWNPNEKDETNCAAGSYRTLEAGKVELSKPWFKPWSPDDLLDELNRLTKLPGSGVTKLPSVPWE